MNLIKYTFTILEVLVVFNMIIFAHELGHFLAARWRKMKVDRFAIWFGKPIWKKKIGGVEYALGCIPFGGYVSLPQMAPMEMIEGKAEDDKTEQLPPPSPLDKIIVAFAGPLFSFGLAILFAVVVWQVGKPATATEANSTVVGWLDTNGPGYKMGLRPGDKILAIDQVPVTQFYGDTSSSINWRIVTSEGSNILVEYERNGQVIGDYAVPVRRETHWYERKDVRHLMIAPVTPLVIDELATNSPAAIAGIQKGDQITSLNGTKIYNYNSIIELEDSMTNGSVKPVVFGILRDGQKLEKTITPVKPLKPARKGPSFGILSLVINTNEILEYPRPFDQINENLQKIFGVISTIISKKSDVGVGQLGGAVTIIRVYSILLDSPNGWRQVFAFSVFLNVNLALINLMPFPVLDGGHILLALLELLFRRKLSARILNFVQNAFAILLIGFLAFTFFFDTGDWLRSAAKDRDSVLEFAAPK